MFQTNMHKNKTLENIYNNKILIFKKNTSISSVHVGLKADYVNQSFKLYEYMVCLTKECIDDKGCLLCAKFNVKGNFTK